MQSPQREIMSASQEGLAPEAADACEALVRAGDYDRWLATLFVPADKRPHLHALYAFNVEIATIPERIAEPGLGEIRLQWWLEAIAGGREGESQAHPIAAALAATRARFSLPTKPFEQLIEARRFDLWSDPAPDLHWLEGYCGETSSVLFRLATLILGEGRDPGGAEACGHAGLAWAFTGLVRATAWHAAAGRVYAPGDMLARRGASADDVRARRATPPVLEALGDLRAQARLHLDCARKGLADLDPQARPALRPLALVDLYLRRMNATGWNPFENDASLPSWRKIWALWRG